MERTGFSQIGCRGELVLYEPVGCPACQGTGFRGQTALIEVLVVSDAIRRLILSHAEGREIHRMAVEEGMRPMYFDGLLKVLAGTTTLEEVLRVTRDV